MPSCHLPGFCLCLSAISTQLAIILSFLSEENPCLGVKTLGSALSSAVSLLPLFHPVLPFLTQSRVERAFPTSLGLCEAQLQSIFKKE